MKTFWHVCAVFLLHAALCLPASAQAIPDWLNQINPADYALLAKELPTGLTVLGDINAEAEAKGVAFTNAQGKTTQAQTHILSVLENVQAVNNKDHGCVTLCVWVCESNERAIALAREHYGNYGMVEDWPVKGKDMPPAAPPKGGSMASQGKVLIRYKHLVGNFTWNGKLEAFGDQKTRQVAALWLRKVSASNLPDLQVESSSLCLTAWVRGFKDREEAADKQWVFAQVKNVSPNVAANNVQAVLSVRTAADAEPKPIGAPVNLGVLGPRVAKNITFVWDLKGQNVTDATLILEVSSPGLVDADPTDNVCDLPCSIYFAQNARGAYRWLEDSYQFENWGYSGLDLQELCDGVLATVIGQSGTDPHTAELLKRLFVPRTFVTFWDYLQDSTFAGAGGHCYGMSATAGLYFMDPSTRPRATDTWNLSKAEAAPNINIYHRAQMVPLAQAMLSGDSYPATEEDALKCLDAVRQGLRTSRQPVMLSIWGTRLEDTEVTVNGVTEIQQETKWWGHSLLAYKLVEAAGRRRAAIYVYDPNLPPMQQAPTDAPLSVFAIDPKTGVKGWSSDLKRLYLDGNLKMKNFGVRGIVREIPVTEYNALMPVLRAKLKEMMDLLALGNKIAGVLRCPADAVFTDPQGRRVGNVNGKVICDVPGAEVVVKGDVEIYTLPADRQWSLAITGTGAGKVSFDVIRPVNGEASLTSFQDMPITPGGKLTGSLAAGGTLATLSGAGTTHAPKLVGSVPLKGGSAPTPVAAALQYVLKSPSSSFAWPDGYPAAGGAFELEFRYEQAGTILDTVGINAAVPGDFALWQMGDGTLLWQIYSPGVPGAHRNQSGWHVLTATRKLKPGQWYRARVTWGKGGMSLDLDGRTVASDPALLALSGRPLFIGDYPGDDGWGSRYKIHPAMVGTVRGLRAVSWLVR